MSEAMDTTDGKNGVKGANGAASPKKLWEHPTPKTTKMTEFMGLVNKKYKLDLKSYEDLHQWSISNVSKLWAEVWDFTGVKAEKSYDEVYCCGL